MRHFSITNHTSDPFWIISTCQGSSDRWILVGRLKIPRAYPFLFSSPLKFPFFQKVYVSEKTGRTQKELCFTRKTVSKSKSPETLRNFAKNKTLQTQTRFTQTYVCRVLTQTSRSVRGLGLFQMSFLVKHSSFYVLFPEYKKIQYYLHMKMNYPGKYQW